jgi:hypothetical protein
MPNRFVEPRPGETATRYCAADSQEQWKQMADALQAQFDRNGTSGRVPGSSCPFRDRSGMVDQTPMSELSR